MLLFFMIFCHITVLFCFEFIHVTVSPFIFSDDFLFEIEKVGVDFLNQSGVQRLLSVTLELS